MEPLAGTGKKNPVKNVGSIENKFRLNTEKLNSNEILSGAPET